MLCGTVVGLELMGQGVWFDIPCTWVIRRGKVKAIKEQCPSGLTGAQQLARKKAHVTFGPLLMAETGLPPPRSLTHPLLQQTGSLGLEG